MGHPHAHTHGHGAVRAGARHKRRLLAAFVVLAAVMVAEVVGAVLTNSLALLSDAGHMLTDVGGLGMALAAIHLADTSRRGGARTFGLYRLEILAALANAVLLFAVGVYVWSKWCGAGATCRRCWSAPCSRRPAWLPTRRFAAGRGRESLNVEGAYLRCRRPRRVGRVIAAAVIGLTGWEVDLRPRHRLAHPPTWRLAPGAAHLGRRRCRPLHTASRADLLALEGVVDVDLHVDADLGDGSPRRTSWWPTAPTPTPPDQARVMRRSRHRPRHAASSRHPRGLRPLTW